jgi:hypothetical protein
MDSDEENFLGDVLPMITYLAHIFYRINLPL